MKLKKRTVGVGTVEIGERAKEYVMAALNSNRLSHGPFLQRFEKEFATLHERKFATSCNSGTSALLIAVGALKEYHSWNDGDEILVPAITFIATSNVILQNGLKPVFVDVDPATYNIDPNKIEEKITSKTRALLPVHLFGLSAEMEPIMEIANRHGLKVIEDSCETMFVKYKGRPAGSRGHIACFSTYSAHLVVTGVGGVALTNDPEYAIIMKSMMNHGRDSIYLNIDDDSRLTTKEETFSMADQRFSFVRMGHSFRLTELEGALGCAELENWEENLKARLANAHYVIEHLSHHRRLIQLPTWPQHSEHAFMMFPIVLKDNRLSRKDLVTHLEENGIETRYMMPLLNQPYYQKIFGNLEDQYPVAKWINNNGFYIGCHQNLTEEDRRYLVRVLDTYLTQWS